MTYPTDLLGWAVLRAWLDAEPCETCGLRFAYCRPCLECGVRHCGCGQALTPFAA